MTTEQEKPKRVRPTRKEQIEALQIKLKELEALEQQKLAKLNKDKAEERRELLRAIKAQAGGVLNSLGLVKTTTNDKGKEVLDFAWLYGFLETAKDKIKVSDDTLRELGKTIMDKKSKNPKAAAALSVKDK